MVHGLHSYGDVLYKGNLLFLTHDEMELLTLIAIVLQPVPQHMLNESRDAAKKELLLDFDGSELRIDNLFSRKKDACKELSELVLFDHRLVVACAELMLKSDPYQRWTAAALLEHDFFSVHFDD